MCWFLCKSQRWFSYPSEHYNEYSKKKKQLELKNLSLHQAFLIKWMPLHCGNHHHIQACQRDEAMKQQSHGRALRWLAHGCTSEAGAARVPPDGRAFWEGRRKDKSWRVARPALPGQCCCLGLVPALKSPSYFPQTPSQRSFKHNPLKQRIASEGTGARPASAKSCELPQLPGHPDQRRLVVLRCGGLTLVGPPVPTMLLSHSTFSARLGEKIWWNSLRVEIRTGRSFTSYLHGQNRLGLGKINSISCQLIIE